MSRDQVEMQYLVEDTSRSINTIKIIENTVTQANGTQLISAFACKDDSQMILVKNSTLTDQTITILAGDKQNAILGDKTIAIEAGETLAINLMPDSSRFEKIDGSVDIDYSIGFTGTIALLGTKAGLE